MRIGTVYLVGAGPGDPGLLTLRGDALLREAEVVIYDHLVPVSLLARCRVRVKAIYAGKQADRHTATQTSINGRLIREARAGRMVVRLKGGDPLLFGRGGEEALALRRAGVPYEIVPGVSSVQAAPAYAGIPLTHRAVASSIGIATGHEDPFKPGPGVPWESLAHCDTIVCLMGVRTLPQLVRRLRRAGRKAATPVAIIEWGTWPTQRTTVGRLDTIVDRARRTRVAPPAVIVMGDVVRLRRRLAWYRRPPLAGMRVLVTRSGEKAEGLSRSLEALGGVIETLPAIRSAPVAVTPTFRAAVRALPDTEWVFFTSPEGIVWFRRMLAHCRRDLRSLAGCHIGAVGPKTAASLDAMGLHVDLMPADAFRQEGLVRALQGRIRPGMRGMIFCAERSREVLERGLQACGMQVKRIAVYRTVMPKELRAHAARLASTPPDFVTATSASTVEHLAAALGARKRQLFRHVGFISIGPVTSAAVRRQGGRVAAEAHPSTIEGLIAATVRAAKRP